ncbi:MAG: protein kinase [Bacillota bacterium]|nr:protein kinase [Bacillota bacterium]
MPSKITIKVNKGNLAGKEFSYDSKESLILGRSSDCSIVFPESTISRYHCMLEITPPAVTVRDFGSLNATYLNGSVIGRRPESMSVEDARGQRYNEFPVKAGDRLGLGPDCELILSVYIPQYCSDCLNELPEKHDERFKDGNGLLLCEACYNKLQEINAERKRKEGEQRRAAEKAEQDRKEAERRAAELAAKEKEAADRRAREKAAAERKEAERRAAELAAKEKAEAERLAREEAARRAEEVRRALEKAMKQHKKCDICGTAISGSKDDVNICSSCRNDPMKVLEFLLYQAMNGVGDAKEIAGYRKIRSLGRGGMGEAWLVEETTTGKQLALKLMLPQVAVNERSRNMFLREAFLAQQLNHKNVVRQYKNGSSGDTFFIIQEFCEGGSLDNVIDRMGGRLSVEYATETILQVLDGLIYTHAASVDVKLKDGTVQTANGVVHRDFKPGNVFLTGNPLHPTAKVADFGLAKAFETAGLSGNTRTGELAGTPGFMPRQQILNFRYAKPDVDVWAAAASYYFMLTGVYPKDLSGKDIFAAALANSAVPVRSRNSHIPRRLAAVIDAALIDKPAIQIKTAAELKKMIEAAL